MSRAWAGGSTRRWRRTRAQILLRDEYLCQIRRPGTWITKAGTPASCATTADCVHHIVGRTASGDDPAYLVAACTPCNLAVGDPNRAETDPEPRRMTQW